MERSYSWVFYLLLFLGSLCGRAFSSWIVLKDIVLTDKSILKKFVGFSSLGGFPRGKSVYSWFVVLVFLTVILLYMVIMLWWKLCEDLIYPSLKYKILTWYQSCVEIIQFNNRNSCNICNWPRLGIHDSILSIHISSSKFAIIQRIWRYKISFISICR